jgi:hypothetical protein
MRRLSAKVGVGLVLSVGGSALAAGCAENDATLFIIGVAKMESDCTYSASASTVLLPRGRYDVGFEGSYQVGLVLGNQMASRGQKSRSRSETSRIILEGAEVSLSLPSGSQFRPPFSAPGAGFVDVSSGSEPGYGIVTVVVVPYPSEYQSRKAAVDAGYVLAEIKAFGKTLGGQAVESNVFRFPIDVCYGCLVTFPASELGADGCELSTDTTGVPCVWGQDSQVDCATCVGSYPGVCKNPGVEMPVE